MRIKITSDSTCDLSSEQVARHNIHIFPLSVRIGERDLRDGVDAVPQDIYAHVDQGGDLPATAAVSVGEYRTAFEQFSAEYDAVIHLDISLDFSCCHQNAAMAAEGLDNVYVVDSRNLSTGHGLLVLKAAELAESGMEAQKIAEILKETAPKVDASFIMDRLDYMKKGGRCSSITVLGANLLKLKPCIEVRDGKMLVAKKYRGGFDACVKAYIADRISGRDDLDLQRVFLTHSGVSDSCIQTALDTVHALQPFQEVCVTTAGCTISSHCGPGTIGILFIRK
ncbi:MAG: DegV family protein [Candidatus Avoscillospira sp.]